MTLLTGNAVFFYSSNIAKIIIVAEKVVQLTAVDVSDLEDVIGEEN